MTAITKKQCQAFAKSSGAQCTKKPLPGTKYCFWHQSWGFNVIGAITLLIVGAIISPLISDVYRIIFPSQESVALSNLGDKVNNLDKSAEGRDRTQDQKLNEILAIQGNDKARYEYITAHKALIDLLAEKVATEFNYDLLQKQRESHKRIETVSEEIANKYELIWEPTFHFIIRLLDDSFYRLQEKGYLSKIESKDSPVVVSEKSQINMTARKYIFKDGSLLEVRKQSGRVESGKLSQSFHVYLEFIRPGYPGDSLLQFDFYSDRTLIRNASKILNVENYETADNPMDDKEFISKIVSDIPIVINYAIVHSDFTLK